MFRWAVGNELIPAAVYQALTAVEGLRAGRESVRETEPVGPVPDEHVAAALPHMSAPVRAMVQVQRLTGMRPGEVTRMRGADIDRSGAVWLYRPARHKNRWRGKARVVPLGPKAQEVLGPWLKADPTEYLFRPADAVAERNAEKRRNRRSPLTPSQRARRPKPNPKRAPGGVYHTRAYAYAIRRACVRAGVPPWGPNRLRHSAATEIRAKFSLEHAKALLGHNKVETTTVYAEADLSRAVEVMREVG
jgi:integrase